MKLGSHQSETNLYSNIFWTDIFIKIQDSKHKKVHLTCTPPIVIRHRLPYIQSGMFYKDSSRCRVRHCLAFRQAEFLTIERASDERRQWVLHDAKHKAGNVPKHRTECGLQNTDRSSPRVDPPPGRRHNIASPRRSPASAASRCQAHILSLKYHDGGDEKCRRCGRKRRNISPVRASCKRGNPAISGEGKTTTPNSGRLRRVSQP